MPLLPDLIYHIGAQTRSYSTHLIIAVMPARNRRPWSCVSRCRYNGEQRVGATQGEVGGSQVGFGFLNLHMHADILPLALESPRACCTKLSVRPPKMDTILHLRYT